MKMIGPSLDFVFENKTRFNKRKFEPKMIFFSLKNNLDTNKFSLSLNKHDYCLDVFY